MPQIYVLLYLSIPGNASFHCLLYNFELLTFYMNAQFGHFVFSVLETHSVSIYQVFTTLNFTFRISAAYFHTPPFWAMNGRNFLGNAKRRNILDLPIHLNPPFPPNLASSTRVIPNFPRRFSSYIHCHPDSAMKMFSHLTLSPPLTHIVMTTLAICTDDVHPNYLWARPAFRGDSLTLITSNINTRLALQRFITNPVLLSEIDSWVNGGLFCNAASTHHFAAKPLHKHQIARFLVNFESPIITVKIDGKTSLACCDTGCSGILMSFGMFIYLFPKATLAEYCGLNYRQASGSPLSIEGQFEATLTIGTLSAHTTFVVMSGPETYKELLLGWRFFRSFNISVCPDGLYLLPQPISTAIPCSQRQGGGGGLQRRHHVTKRVSDISPPQPPLLHKGRADPPLTHGGAADPPTALTFPVHVVKSYTVLPLQKTLVLCKLKNISQFSLQHLRDKFMCFSSEHIEKHIPLLDLSVYFQIVPQTELFRNVSLLYQNVTKQTVFLFEDQHIADCVEMRQAAAADMRHEWDTHPDVYMAARILNQNTPSLCSPPHSQFELKIEQEYSPLDFSKVDTHDATPAQRAKLLALLKKFPKLFSSHTWSVGVFDSTVDLRARTNAVPQQQKYIPCPRRLQSKCQIIIKKLLDYGLIVENPDSPWRSNILFLVKPDKSSNLQQQNINKDPVHFPQKEPGTNIDRGLGTPPGKTGQDPISQFGPGHKNVKKDNDIPISRIRLVMDMTMINSHLKRTWPSCVLPKIDDIFQYCYGMKYLSRYDLTQSFWSKKVSKSMMDLSTFYFMGKAYSMTRMCQGCCASSEVFQTSINKIIHKNKLSPEQNIKFCGKTSCQKVKGICSDTCGKSAYGVFAYIDDIFIVSRNEEDHYFIIEKTLQVFHDANLKIKLEKTDLFITSSCDILGFHLDLANSCISPAKKNLDKVVSLPAPSNFKKLQRFCGAVTFYCHLIPDFSSLLSPLTDLLKSTEPWCWGPNQQDAYDQVLRKMAAQPTLFILNPDAPIFAVTDGCLKKSISYCQLQWHRALQTWCPVRFQSHKLSAHMVNYAQAQVEALSLCTYASENYALLMSHVSHVFSDAKSLSFVSRFRYNNLTIWRYHLLLSSLPLVFHWLSCDAPLLILCDLFTRERTYDVNPLDKFKQVLNKRLSPTDIENLQCIDFSHLPSMTYEQVMKILDAFHKILEKNTPDEVVKKLKTSITKLNFPILPHHTFRHRNNVFNVNNDLQNNTVGELKLCLNHLSGSSISPQDPLANYNDGFLISQNKSGIPDNSPDNLDSLSYQISAAQEKLQFYFPSHSTATLIQEQNKDVSLQNLYKNHPKVFIKIDGILCHKKEYQSVFTYTLCWPSQHNVALLRKAHIIGEYNHLKKPKLKGELLQYFHIRQFDKAYDLIGCKYCEMNTRQYKLSLPLGIPFQISQPRTFIAMDIGYVNTDWTFSGFLVICDVSNQFMTAFPVTQNATAADIYKILITRWQIICGQFIGLCTDNAKNFNCKLSADLAQLCGFVHIKITPQNSRANRAEAAVKYTLASLRAMQQSNSLTEDNFEIMLAYTCTLWNSTYSPALKMSPAEHFFFNKIRTNNFVTFSSLLHSQHRNVFSRNVSRIISLLNIIRLKKRENYLKQQKIWDDHKDAFVVGSFCFIQKDRVKKAGWKLREIFDKNLYQVVKVFRTYLFLIPVSGTLSILKSPYVQGNTETCTARRVHKSRVKICHNPISFLDLQNVKHFIEQAASILGTGEPARQVYISANPSLRSQLLPAQMFKANLYQVTRVIFSRTQSSYFPQDSSFPSAFVADRLPAVSSPVAYSLTSVCHTFSPETLMSAVVQDSPFFSFQTTNSWIFLDKKLRDSFITSGQFSPATCSHGLTEKYKRYRMELLEKRNQLDAIIPGKHYNKQTSKKLYKKEMFNQYQSADKFQNKMDKYLISIKKSKVPQLCVDKILQLTPSCTSSTTSEWKPPPVVRSPVSSSSSATSSSQGLPSSQSGQLGDIASSISVSASLHSALGDAQERNDDDDGHHDGDDADGDDLEAGKGSANGEIDEDGQNYPRARSKLNLTFVSDDQILNTNGQILDTNTNENTNTNTNTNTNPKQKNKRKSSSKGMMTIAQALTPPSSSSAPTRRRSIRVKIKKPPLGN